MRPNQPSQSSAPIDGRYELERPLGQGNMGNVWQALDLRTQRRVAIKRLNSAGADAAQRVARELRALAPLRHPNLVDVLDCGATAEGVPYLVMELVQGTTLADELRRLGRLPAARVCRIGSQVARALVAAHAEGVVHRDLKPSNIMLSELYGERDVVKLVDFGVAGLVDGTQESLSGALFVGTPDYASPEQALGQATSPATDLYALGVVLHEALAGARPFGAETSMGVLFHHVYTPARRLSALGVAVPEWLDELVASLLRKDPGTRPSSAQAVVIRLQEQSALLGAGERADEAHTALPQPLPAPPGSTLDGEALPSRRSGLIRRRALVMGILGVPALSALFFYVLDPRRGREGTAPASASPAAQPTLPLTKPAAADRAELDRRRLEPPSSAPPAGASSASQPLPGTPNLARTKQQLRPTPPSLPKAVENKAAEPKAAPNQPQAPAQDPYDPVLLPNSRARRENRQRSVEAREPGVEGSAAP